jgi:hypothetical protein
MVFGELPYASLNEAIEWASNMSAPVTLFLYDGGGAPEPMPEPGIVERPCKTCGFPTPTEYVRKNHWGD